MENLVLLGVMLVFAATAWMLYALYATQKIKESVRERTTISKVATLVRLRNASIVIALYSLSFICFLTVGQSLLDETSIQYQVRSNVIELLTGTCAATIGFAMTAQIARDMTVSHLKYKVRRRAWTRTFWQNTHNASLTDVVAHK